MKPPASTLLLILVLAGSLSPTRAQEPGGLASEPLKPRGTSSPGTLFELLDPARTGIDFINHGSPQRTNQAGQIIFFATSSGKDTAGGVAIGDYDLDGLPDVFLTRSSGGNRLYRNLGGFRFEDVTTASGLGGDDLWSMGCSFVDIDGDGDLDLHLSCYDQPNRLYVNDGNGRFEDRAGALGLDFKGSSVMMAFADYDGDGDIDGYLLTNFLEQPGARDPVKVRYSEDGDRLELPPEKLEVVGGVVLPDRTVRTFPSGQRDHLFRNEGGRFLDVSDEAGISGYEMGLSATWWDYDDDGLPDLYVANDFYGQDRLYHNEGRGRFKEVIRRAMPSTPWYSMGSDAADLNNDGRLDYLATDMSGTTHFKDKMGMGDMAESAWFLTLPEPRQYMRNSVFINTGTERFLEVGQMTGLARSDWTWSVKLSDFDNDGRVDVFFANGMTRDLFNSDLKEQEAALMKSRDLEKVSAFWRDQPVKKDINLAFRNEGDLKFKSSGKEWGLDQSGVSFGAASADLDGDGDLDLVVNNYQEPALVYQNRSGSHEHAVEVRLRGRSGNRSGLGARVRLTTDQGSQVRYVTLSRGYMSSDPPVAHFGLGAETQIRSIQVRWPGGSEQTYTDPPPDHVHTITEDVSLPATPMPPPPATLFLGVTLPVGGGRIERPYDDFKRQPLLPNQLSTLGPGMAWGDVNGDGQEDLFVSQPAGWGGLMYLRGQGGSFQAGSAQPFDEHAESEDMAPLLFDADGDGDLDLYVVSGGVECEPGAEVLRDRLYLNDGQGRFKTAADGTLPDWKQSGSVVAASDFDRDGDLDLFVGGRSIPGQYPVSPESALLVNEGGRFVDRTDDRAAGLRRSGLVTSGLWSDVDEDGWVDLLVTCEWGPIRLFRNQGGRLIERTGEAGLSEWSGWWNGIVGGDVDHDGDIDYVVSNFGLNTKYKASPASPAILYYGDFDGTGKAHPLEAKLEGGTLLPRRGFSCSRNAMPFLDSQLKTFANFAASPLMDLYSSERLANALKLEINTLESGLLLNRGGTNGQPVRFQFKPFPRLAQVAPVFGVALADVDGDGHLDCYLAQNFYGPQPETGRMDGGVSLLLRGDGTGAFDPVPPRLSGLLLPGDAKSLTTLDLSGNGFPDFVVGVNGGYATLFENRGTPGHRTLRVRLKGKPGNSSGVGARVRLLGASTTQTAEVHAGGGYLSQSPSQILFGLGRQPFSGDLVVRWPDATLTTNRLERAEGLVTVTQE